MPQGKHLNQKSRLHKAVNQKVTSLSINDLSVREFQDNFFVLLPSGVKDGIGSFPVVSSGSGQTARIDQKNAFFFPDQRNMRVTEADDIRMVPDTCCRQKVRVVIYIMMVTMNNQYRMIANLRGPFFRKCGAEIAVPAYGKEPELRTMLQNEIKAALRVPAVNEHIKRPFRLNDLIHGENIAVIVRKNQNLIIRLVHVRSSQHVSVILFR